MFTRAGFKNRVRRTGIRARISIIGGRRAGWAVLVRFRSGDFAWRCTDPEFICWGLRAHIHNHPSLWVPFGVIRDAPFSSIDGPEAIAWRQQQVLQHEALPERLLSIDPGEIMSATASDTALAKPNLILLALSAIVPSKSHVQERRRARFSKEELKDFAAEIKRDGIFHQPLVRPIAGGRFELIAGERRWLAAGIAGMKEIYVNVRDLTDNLALKLQLSENLQRKDLHELEEAEGYEELMNLEKISAAEVADMVGRDPSYVSKRIKLLALCPEARKAFYAGDIDASKALLIARIGHHDTQRTALKEITVGYNGAGPMTYRQAADHIQREYMLRLVEAPFDINDAELLPKAGTCQACPKRTGNQKELFGDIKGADICTDPKCFDDKRQAFFAESRKRIEAAGGKVIFGEAAKKALPNWDSTHGGDSHRNYLQGGYVALNATTYISGRERKTSDVLGKDYEPILIQHPRNGKIIEVATQQALAKALSKPGDKKTPGRVKAKADKPKGPDVDEALRARLIKLIHEKAPKVIGKGQLQVLLGRLLSHLNVRQEELADVAAQWGWERKAFNSGGYHSSRKLPKQALALDVRDLLLLAIEFTFLADRYQRKTLLDLFDIDEKKTRELIIEERKAAAKAEREAKKKVKPAKKASAPTATRAPARRKSDNSSITTLHQPSEQLAAVLGNKPMFRTEVTKKLWIYIKKQGLQDKKNRRMINADDKLKALFGGKDQVSMFDMTKLINKHLTVTRPAKA